MKKLHPASQKTLVKKGTWGWGLFADEYVKAGETIGGLSIFNMMSTKHSP